MRIGIAGSMQFTDDMLRVAAELRARGHDVFVSDFADRYAGKTAEEIEELKLVDKFKHDAIREFWKPMQTADALLILNYQKHGIPGYIGGNAFLEMGFAHVLNQKIFTLYPPADMPYYGTEIRAINPIVIHDDLTKITP